MASLAVAGSSDERSDRSCMWAHAGSVHQSVNGVSASLVLLLDNEIGYQ